MKPLQAKHTVGLVFFPAFDWAISHNHPEREERLLYTQDQVLEEGLLDVDGIVEFKPDVARHQDVQRVHFCVPDVAGVTKESHLISAGGALTIGRSVMEKEVAKGFALVRPPGHHAMRVVHGARGFCNINIEAVMIEYLRRTYGVDRVAVVDTDCHHGDGTQDIYWHDPDTLFISLHQDGRTLYPGSGFPGEAGGPTAAGTTINIPLPPHTSAEGFLYVTKNAVLPILADFKPDLIVNSAGQDNHYADPITQMNFSAQGYAELTALLKPDIAVLEGGYAIESALPYVNVGILLAMAGLDYRRVREPGFNPEEIRQPPEADRWAEQISEMALATWQNREQLRKEMAGNAEFHERERQIYYDTDNITERQQETLRICTDCSGALRIDSTSNRKGRILAIHLPRKACPQCTAVARRWYETADLKDYPMVCFQDRPEDRYEVRRQDS